MAKIRQKVDRKDNRMLGRQTCIKIERYKDEKIENNKVLKYRSIEVQKYRSIEV